MTINYYGQMKDTKVNTRIATINYKEEEQKNINRLLTLMRIQVPSWYNKVSLFENMITIGISDREEYEELVEWYKEIKKSISLWNKFNI